jgi:hypothetical protein
VIRRSWDAEAVSVLAGQHLDPDRLAVFVLEAALQPANARIDKPEGYVLAVSPHQAKQFAA